MSDYEAELSDNVYFDLDLRSPVGGPNSHDDAMVFGDVVDNDLNDDDGGNELYDQLENADNEDGRESFDEELLDLFEGGDPTRPDDMNVVYGDYWAWTLGEDTRSFDDFIRDAVGFFGHAPPIQPRVAPFAAPRVLDDATKQRLRQQRIDNERPSVRFSRDCGICYAVNPLLRAVYTRCGHIVCLPCAEEQSYEGNKCPFCRAEGDYIRLREEEKEIEAADGN